MVAVCMDLHDDVYDNGDDACVYGDDVCGGVYACGVYGVFLAAHHSLKHFHGQHHLHHHLC